MILRTLDCLRKLSGSRCAAARVKSCRRRFLPQVESLEERWLPSNYSVNFGGSKADTVTDISVDSAGNALVVGYTVSSDFPTPSGYDRSFNGDTDGFIAKLDPSGKVVWATYLGGPGNDRATSVAVDAAGDVYVAGIFMPINSDDTFPTTPGAFLTTPVDQYTQTWAAKFDGATGGLVFSTFVGGGFNSAIAVDTAGYVYVAADSANFPTTPGAFQTTRNVSDLGVAKLNPTGTALVYSTYLGGPGSDQLKGMAVDGAGRACLFGFTNSPDFPTTSGAFQTAASGTFVTELNATGSALAYSTYLGWEKSGADGGIAVDDVGNIYVTTDALASFPTTPGAFESLHSDDGIVVAKLNPGLSGTDSLVYSTFIGHGAVSDIAVNTSGEACIAGSISDDDFPTTPGAPDTTGNGFLTRLNSTGSAGSAVLFSTHHEREVIALALDGAGNAFLASEVYNSQSSYDISVAKLPASDSGPAPLLASLACTDVSPSENVPLFYFNVHRWGPVDQTVTVNFTTSDGTATARSDYVATSGTLTFAPGEVTKTIPVTINQGGKSHPSETFYVVLSNATNATIQRDGTGTIPAVFHGHKTGTLAARSSAASITDTNSRPSSGADSGTTLSDNSLPGPQNNALASTLLTLPGTTNLSLTSATLTETGPVTLPAPLAPVPLPADRDTDVLDRIFRTLADEAPQNPSRLWTGISWEAIQSPWLDSLEAEEMSLDGGKAAGQKPR